MLKLALQGLLIALYSVSSYALPKVDFKNSCVPLEQFSPSQKEVLLHAYLAGEAEGFGYTLAAIAWKESCAGVYKMNFQDPSAGNFHAYIPGVIKRYPELKQNGFTQNMVGAMLVDDDDFAAKIAITELKFWYKEHKGNWKNIIKSYNKGYTWQKNSQSNTQAEFYYTDIANKIKQLQGYFQTPQMQSIALNLSKKSKKNDQPFYALKEKPNKEDKKEIFSLPIYQRANEFAAPLIKKPTIFKEFDLIDID
ncbi:hypothetical protein [Helicobacter apodemus]|uniref:hypothetical protein n=1 Tax=Helicobacter apodemus TaxID=135569 RepID=UPI00051FB30A|nr:hypothetical protein [Helicobacter apodemus]